MNETVSVAASYALVPAIAPPGPVSARTGVPDAGALDSVAATVAVGETPVAPPGGACTVTVGGLAGAVVKTTSTK